LFLLGFIVGYSGSVDFFVANGLRVYPFGFVSFSLFVLIIAYAIVRHQFLEIDVIGKRIFLIILIYATLFSLLLPIVFPFFNKILKQSTEYAWMVILLSAGIGIVFSLGPFIYAGLVRHSFWLRGVRQPVRGSTNEV
jgi:hypothetical protein